MEPLRRILRPSVHAVRSLRDRGFHPLRRTRARTLVRGVSAPRAVLFLCTGNICRSPYAEKVFQQTVVASAMAPADLRIESGGYLAPGRPSPPEAVRLAAERGISLAAHRSRTLDADLLDGVELVVVMEVAHLQKLRAVPGGGSVPALLLGDLDPLPPTRREIRDPWGQGDAVYRESFERIDRCLGVLASELGIAGPQVA